MAALACSCGTRKRPPQLVHVSGAVNASCLSFPPRTLLELAAPLQLGGVPSAERNVQPRRSLDTPRVCRASWTGQLCRTPAPKAPGAADSLAQLAEHGARVPSLCAHPSTSNHDHLRAMGLTFSG